jgi:hypothetical protein
VRTRHGATPRRRSLRTGPAALAAAAAAGLVAASAAGGQASAFDHATLRYTAHQPASRTGFIVDVARRSVRPAGGQVRYRLSPGTRIDTSAIARCDAADLAILADGPSACPAASRLGAGTADLAYGTGTLTVAVTAFNAEDQIVAVFSLLHTDTVVRVLRAAVHGSVVSVQLGNGPGAGVPRLRLDIAPRGSRARPWARTPPHCPAAGRWSVGVVAGGREAHDATACRSRP